MDSKKIALSFFVLVLFAGLIYAYGIKSAVDELSVENTHVNENPEHEEPVIDEKVTVYFFWSNSCPYCHRQIPFMEKMSEKYDGIEIHSLELSNNENRMIFQNMMQAYGARSGGVPQTYIGESDPIIGFGSDETTGRQIEERIIWCAENGCIDPATRI